LCISFLIIPAIKFLSKASAKASLQQPTETSSSNNNPNHNSTADYSETTPYLICTPRVRHIAADFTFTRRITAVYHNAVISPRSHIITLSDTNQVALSATQTAQNTQS